MRLIEKRPHLIEILRYFATLGSLKIKSGFFTNRYFTNEIDDMFARGQHYVFRSMERPNDCLSFISDFLCKESEESWRMRYQEFSKKDTVKPGVITTCNSWRDCKIIFVTCWVRAKEGRNKRRQQPMELGFYNFLNTRIMCVTSIVVPVKALRFNPRGTGTGCKRIIETGLFCFARNCCPQC